MAMSSSSPTLWPSESLITLNRSRSNSSTATPRPRVGLAIEAGARREPVASRKAQRLGSPVNGSWRDW